jgi:TPR repeat protein
MYYHGEGVEQSYERAKEYYESAAHLGHAGSQFNLGAMYYNGQGVENNLTKAREWWIKAAAQGDENAIANLKLMDN